MEFFIRQGASDPILKMRMIDDGKNDKSSFNDALETATITLEILDTKTDNYEILDSPCNLVLRTKKHGHQTDELYITHRFTKQQTSKIGRFEGKININFADDNLLIVPITEKLFINIIS
jgi:hypothetical protein